MPERVWFCFIVDELFTFCFLCWLWFMCKVFFTGFGVTRTREVPCLARERYLRSLVCFLPSWFEMSLSKGWNYEAVFSMWFFSFFLLAAAQDYITDPVEGDFSLYVFFALYFSSLLWHIFSEMVAVLPWDILTYIQGSCIKNWIYQYSISPWLWIIIPLHVISAKATHIMLHDL